MTTCWKCGAATGNNDSECDDCAAGLTPKQRSDKAFLAAVERECGPLPPPRVFAVDWTKINSWEDFREFAAALFPCVIVSNQEAFERVKKFLKEGGS